MLSMWQCTHCDLRNYDRNEYCQACFNKAVERSPFQQIMYQQTILLHGYVREKILIHLHYDNPVPIDIINLCLRFFQINIKSMCTEIDKEHTNSNDEKAKKVMEIESTCDCVIRLAENDEYWLSLQLMSVLLTTGKRMGADNEEMCELHCVMASVYIQWNLPNKALQHVLIAHNADPLNAEHIFGTAYCYEILKDFIKAKQYYLKSIQLAPNDATYHRGYAQLLCAELNELDLAKIHFDKAIELEPNECVHYHFYAKHLRDYFKDYKESEKQYLKCLAIEAENPGTNGSYGHLLYLMGEYDAAKKHIEIELNVNDKNNFAHYYMGLVYNALGDEQKANESLHEAVRICSQSINGGMNIDYLKIIKAADPDHMEYHNKLEQLILKCKLNVVHTN